MVAVDRLAASHESALRLFFASVPDLDQTFFKEDLSDETLFAKWLSDADAFRFVAVNGADVVGYLAIIRGVGRFKHVAELRVVVAAGSRRSGVGTQLARHGLNTAMELAKANKIVVEVPEPLNEGKAMFEHLGFEPEALLRDHLEDATGASHDLWILSHFVHDNIASLASLGITSSLLGDAS